MILPKEKQSLEKEEEMSYAHKQFLKNMMNKTFTK
jgi:hypothetical protein